jgi:hypothetical protein
MSSVTSCVGGGLFICFTCLHVPYRTVTVNTMLYRTKVCGHILHSLHASSMMQLQLGNLPACMLS